MAERSEASFTEGDLSRHVIRLSGFMILGFLAMTLAQFVEAVYLGLVGTEALAAVTFTFPAVMALGAMTRGLTLGGGVRVARAMGVGDRERAAVLTTHGLLLVLVFTAGCAALLAGFARPLFHLLGARGEVLELVVAYARV